MLSNLLRTALYLELVSPKTCRLFHGSYHLDALKFSEIIVSALHNRTNPFIKLMWYPVATVYCNFLKDIPAVSHRESLCVEDLVDGTSPLQTV